jgi:aminoglycoside phosphotransferase (APT) family kinase protein
VTSVGDAEATEIVSDAERRLGSRLQEVRPLPGGHSGLTLVAEIDVGGHRESVVIKATPPGRKPVGRHDVLRQIRAIEVAQVAIPVPRLLAASSDPPYFVMSFETGEAAEPVHDPEPSGDDASLVATRFDAATDLLAGLHDVDVSSLVAAGEPVVTPTDELAKWERTLAVVDGEHRASGERALRALTASVPGACGPVLVHGDFRLGNILFDGPDAVAVIDWEIWSIGDPRVDLGWYLTFCDAANFPSIGHAHRRLPSLVSLVTRYEATTHRAVDDLDWFLALGAFKMGVVMAHNLERHRSGRHVDPFQERLPRTIERLLDRAADVDTSRKVRR